MKVDAPLAAPWQFGLGVLPIGFGGGLFSHGTLTATMNLAPTAHTGLAMGAWGAVQATSAGIAVALGGLIRDLAQGLPWPQLQAASAEPVAGYMLVYGLEIARMLGTVLVMVPLLRQRGAVALS